MNRLQNIILIVWALLLALFVAFNWQLVNRIVDIEFLWMSFQIQLLLWLILLGFALPLALRLINGMNTHTTQRKKEKEISSIKSKAFDGLSGEFEKLGERLQDKLIGRIHNLYDEFKAKPEESAETEEETEGAPGDIKEEETAGEKSEEK